MGEDRTRRVMLFGGPADGERITVVHTTDQVLWPVPEPLSVMYLHDTATLKWSQQKVAVYARDPLWKNEFNFVGYR